MPQLQVAQVENFEVGAPAVLGTVLLLKAARGGLAIITFENPVGANAVTVNAEVSADGTTYVALTQANNLSVITGVVVKPKELAKTFEVRLREGADVFLRFQASGAARFAIQMRQTAGLAASTF